MLFIHLKNLGYIATNIYNQYYRSRTLDQGAEGGREATARTGAEDGIIALTCFLTI
jgi:hypothetical protein